MSDSSMVSNAAASLQAGSATVTEISARLDWAIAYAKEGYKVLPLNPDCPPSYCEPGCSKPKSPLSALVIHGLSEATTDLATITRWFTERPDANIGIANRASGILTIDLDTHSADADGIKYFDQLKRDEKYPNTPLQLTPGGLSGGRHLIFKHPHDVDVRAKIERLNPETKQKEATGVETRSAAYIVAAPSVVHGKAYKWLKGYSLLDRQPLELPDWLLPYIARPLRLVIDSNSDAFIDDGIEARERLIAALREFGVVAQGDRNASVYKCGCISKEIGVSQHVAVEHITEHLKMETPLTRSEIEKTVASAYLRSQNAQGSKNPDKVFAPFAPSAPSTPSAKAEASQVESSHVEAPRAVSPQMEIPHQHDYPGLDASNAARLATKFGHSMRWLQTSKTWLIWDGKRWLSDNKAVPKACALEIAKLLWRSASTEEERKHAYKSGSKSAVEGMLSLAQPLIAVTEDELDKGPFLLNCNNGTLDLRSGALLPHNSGQLITKLAPVDYDPNAKAPRFEQFLKEIFGGSSALIEFVQRALGSCLTGSVADQKLFIPFGQGANGKSTLMNAVREILGSYAHETAPTLLTKGQQSGPNEATYKLKGIRFATTVESDEGDHLNETLVKQLTGGDPITTRPLWGHLITFEPTHKLWLVTNHRPRIKSQTEAIWRRIRIIPFDVQIPGELRDRHLAEKLRAEYPGILAWLVSGCLKWQQSGLTEPSEVMQATCEYREEEDKLARFIDECCYCDPAVSVQLKDLHACYQLWCRANHESELPKNTFTTRLKEKGIEEKRTNRGQRLIGITVKSDSNNVFSACQPSAVTLEDLV